jgi:hypothetical protein
MAEVTVGQMQDYMERAPHVPFAEHMVFTDLLMAGMTSAARRVYIAAVERENNG